MLKHAASEQLASEGLASDDVIRCILSSEANLQMLLENDGDDLDDSNKEHYPLFVMPKKMTNFKWVLRAKFDRKDEFKEAITNYAIYNRTCLKRFKN
ncbi:hypothetical protein MTR_1g115910 [Medicago truncatula]|uniref:Uncharacterized protein n=1 Tax=Medicago truncatula TaxID=3880 RepID=G7IF05_MEDTR|nr:hypothetical protein MTR_1g115910 [Medicago truncatula]